MRIYTVHLRPASRDPATDLLLVREGFNWFAALFTVLWALWNRYWWIALALLVLELGLEAVLAGLGTSTTQRVVAGIAAALLIGLFANDARRWELGRKGYETVDVVAADDQAAAEQRLFTLRPDLVEELRL